MAESQRRKKRSGLQSSAFPFSPALLPFSTRGCSFTSGGRAKSCGQVHGHLCYNPPSPIAFPFPLRACFEYISDWRQADKALILQRVNLRFRECSFPQRLTAARWAGWGPEPRSWDSVLLDGTIQHLAGSWAKPGPDPGWSGLGTP